MALVMSEQYDPEIVALMRQFYRALPENHRRRYAALEAKQLGYGGIRLVAEVLECSEHTIERGTPELEALPTDPAAGRVRRPGGGRKKRSKPSPNSPRV